MLATQTLALCILGALTSAAGNTWSQTGSMGIGRADHTATRLLDGRVLVVGGFTGVSERLASAEIYDPATGTWAPTTPMSTSRTGHTALLLLNGHVLVAGGYSGGTVNLSSAEVSDPALGTWTPTPAGVIRVSQSSDPVHFDVSDVSLTLAPPTITVTAPNSNVNWIVGSARNITWSQNLGTAATVQIDLSRDGGATWTTLGPAVTNTGNTSGSLPWTVTGPTTTAARIRITWTGDPVVQDVGNVNFRIQ